MQYNQALIKALGDVIYERSLDSSHVVWQGEFTEILGYTPEEMGKDNRIWLERLHLEDRTRIIKDIEMACDYGEPYDLEYRFRHKNDSYIWIQDRGVPTEINNYYGGTTIKVVGVMRDISDRKQAEIDMRKALLRERELNQLKTRFIDIASHEFRTPLTSLLGFTELLEQYAHKFNPDVHRKHLRRIRSAAERLQELVDDVLSVSRADAGNITLELEPLDIEALCNELLHELKAAFGDAQPLNFQLDDKLRIREENTLKPLVDGRIIRHVLSNLLSNALKYSDANGEAIALDIRCTDQQIEFIVQDRGIGIPQEDLEHLFEPFHRATNVGKIPGTGLGLHIVERYVKVHNGTIKVKSTLNLGTTFTVIIPCIFIRDL